MVLLVNLDGAHDSLIKRFGLLLEKLLRILDLLLGTLDLDLSTSRGVGNFASIGNIDLSTRSGAESIHLPATSANEGRNLTLRNGNGGGMGVVNSPLIQFQKLVTGGIGTPLGTPDDDLVGCLAAVVVRSLGTSIRIIVDSSSTREVDAYIIAVLEAVDLASLATNKITVELGLDLQDVGGLILKLLAECDDVSLGSMGLSLRALDLDLAVLNLDVNVKLIAELLDVFSTLANENVSKLLRVVEADGVAALKFVLLLLLDESMNLLSELVDLLVRSTDVEIVPVGARRLRASVTEENLEGNLILRKALLLAVDIAADLVVVPVRTDKSADFYTN